MVRIGIVLAVLTIALMAWAYGQYTHAAGYPRRPRQLENHGLYHPLSGPNGPRPGSPIQHSPYGPDESPVESFYMGSSAAHDGAADCPNLRAAAAKFLRPVSPLCNGTGHLLRLQRPDVCLAGSGEADLSAGGEAEKFILTIINPPLPLPGGGGCGGISAVSPYPERREEIDCFS
jgi:hypothetical protein